MTDTKVVNFPKARAPRQNKTDADHVAAVGKAWRAFSRAVADARNFGLSIDAHGLDIHVPPVISRTYKPK